MKPEEIEKLRNCKSESEWNRTCDEVKRTHNGYPADWYQRIIMGGVLNTARLTHGW